MRSLKRALLIAVAVCGILTTSAGVASAHEWEIKGSPLTVNQPFSSSGGKFEFDWFVLNEHQKWTCSTESGTGKLLTNGKVETTMKFSSCGFTAGGFGGIGCKISTPVESTLKGEIVEAGEKPATVYVRYEGVATAKALIVNLTGCMSAGTWGFTGGFSGAAEPYGTQLTEQPLTFSPAADTAVGTSLYPAGSPKNTVTITGSVKVKLTEINVGAIWGAIF